MSTQPTPSKQQQQQRNSGGMPNKGSAQKLPSPPPHGEATLLGSPHRAASSRTATASAVKSPGSAQPYLGSFEGASATPSPFTSGAPAPHAFGCACPTCVYYAAATLYMADFATPYGLAQQYAFAGGQHMSPQMIQQMMYMNAAAAAHQHHQQIASSSTSPQRSLNFNSSATPQRAMTGARAPVGATPASPSYHADPEATSSSAATSPLRRLDFGGGGGPLTPAAQMEIVEEAIADCDDLPAFCCTPRGRDLAIAALQTGAAGAAQLKAALVPAFVPMCGSELGVHVLRTLIDKLSAAEIAKVITALAAAPANDTLNLATTSQHTRKLLEALLDHRGCDAVSTLESTLVKNTSYLIVLQQGCIALMHLLKISATRRGQIVALVKGMSPAVARDPYGNYVLQTLAEHADEGDVCEIVKGFKGAIGALATNKFASNVLEKVVKGPHQNARRLVVAELIFHADATLRAAVHDKYGNFVVQAALVTAVSVAEHRRMCDRIRPMIVGCPFAARFEQRMKQKRGGGAAVACGLSPNSAASIHRQQFRAGGSDDHCGGDSPAQRQQQQALPVA